VCSTPISFYTIEKFGRRTILIYGALGMLVCEFIVAIVGVTAGAEDKHNHPAVSAQIALICVYIFFFASTWGPGTLPSRRCEGELIGLGAWVLVGEIFPLPTRARGVALSTASNWLWNCIIAVITPYMVGRAPGEANLQSRVFFIWGSLCTACFVYSYVLVPETKGLSLEQVDRMLEESVPRTSAKWLPHSTFAADMGLIEQIPGTDRGQKSEIGEETAQEI
jgi:MFS family permease